MSAAHVCVSVCVCVCVSAWLCLCIASSYPRTLVSSLFEFCSFVSQRKCLHDCVLPLSTRKIKQLLSLLLFAVSERSR